MCSTNTWWPAVAEEAKRLEREVAVEQQIGHEDDEAPPAEQVYDPAERRLGRRALPRLETAEHLHQLAPVAEPRAGRQHGPHLVVEGDEAGGVPLPQENQGERGHQSLGVGELGKDGLGVAGPGHGAADVAHHHGAEVGLFLELLDVEPVVAAEDLPIHVPQLVPRLVHPVLGELDREPASGRPVESGEEALDHALGDHLDAAQPGNVQRVEEVETFGPGHEGRNVSGSRVTGNVVSEVGSVRRGGRGDVSRRPAR